MQALIAGGLPHLGEAFPAHWGHAIRHANPKGFFESRFRQGIRSHLGVSLPAPSATRTHAVKVFVAGLPRSEPAYFDFIVATVRHWRAASASLTALYRAEDAWLENHAPDDVRARIAAKRSTLPPPIEWFLENMALVDFLRTHEGAFTLVSYERFTRAPSPILQGIFAQIGEGSPLRAAAAVDISLNRTSPSSDDFHLSTDMVHHLDRIYGLLDAGDLEGLSSLQRAREALIDQFGGLDPDRGREAQIE